MEPTKYHNLFRTTGVFKYVYKDGNFEIGARDWNDLKFKLAIQKIKLQEKTQEQNKSFNEVNSLLKVSFQQVSELKFIESLKYSEKALQLSQEAKYQKGTIYAYLYIARVLQEVGLRKDALT